MLLDQQTMMSDAQVVTSTGNSSNLYDAGAAINLGAGKHIIPVLFTSGVAGTSPTLTATLVGADDAAFNTNKITICTVTPTLVSGEAARAIHLPRPPSHTPKRYYRMEYTIGGSGGPTVTITAGFAMDCEQTNPSPPIT